MEKIELSATDTPLLRLSVSKKNELRKKFQSNKITTALKNEKKDIVKLDQPLLENLSNSKKAKKMIK